MNRPADNPPAPADLTTTIRRDHEGAVLFVSGEIDASTAPRLRSHLDDFGRDDIGKVVVDLADVTFLDAAGIAVLLNTDARLRSLGARLTVRSPRTAAARVLRAAGAAELLACD